MTTTVLSFTSGVLSALLLNDIACLALAPVVVEQAAQQGFRIGWRDHARVGLPITLITLAIAAGWLWLRSR